MEASTQVLVRAQLVRMMHEDLDKATEYFESGGLTRPPPAEAQELSEEDQAAMRVQCALRCRQGRR